MTRNYNQSGAASSQQPRRTHYSTQEDQGNESEKWEDTEDEAAFSEAASRTRASTPETDSVSEYQAFTGIPERSRNPYTGQTAGSETASHSYGGSSGAVTSSHTNQSAMPPAYTSSSTVGGNDAPATPTKSYAETDDYQS
ncbi:hypothetical protein I316_07397 [Kwoniella heveanensis BCC8398]|uniref:Uncharacterized protein n=1 Tax=Kwoniella heveanensis BCC8398 TaxID=1296120 RepID=A0A1B9GIS7_9TREE|nr:hypothetical protein I316_07397 [Kwoniella heveanensis BCC8398]